MDVRKLPSSSQGAFWSPPELGLLKLNFDGNYIQNCDMAGFCGMVKDHLDSNHPSSLGAHSQSVRPLKQNCMLFGDWRGVLGMESLGAEGGTVEGDSKAILSWVGSLCPWKFLNKVDRIHHSISSKGFSVSWVLREVNSLRPVNWLE